MSEKKDREAFWKYLDENYEEVKKWPGWMRGDCSHHTPTPERVDTRVSTKRLAKAIAAAKAEVAKWKPWQRSNDPHRGSKR